MSDAFNQNILESINKNNSNLICTPNEEKSVNDVNKFKISEDTKKVINDLNEFNKKIWNDLISVSDEWKLLWNDLFSIRMQQEWINNLKDLQCKLDFVKVVVNDIKKIDTTSLKARNESLKDESDKELKKELNNKYPNESEKIEKYFHNREIIQKYSWYIHYDVKLWDEYLKNWKYNLDEAIKIISSNLNWYNYYEIVKIKELYKLGENDLEKIITDINNNPKTDDSSKITNVHYLKESFSNKSLNLDLIEDVTIFATLREEVRNYVVHNKFSNNDSIKWERDFSKIIVKSDSYEMWMLLNARLEKEIIDNKITEEKQKNDYKSNYFKDLSEFLKKNPNHRKIFLNSIESNIDDKNSTYNNNSKFDIRCAMWDNCKFMSETIKENRKEEMNYRLDIIKEKFSSLYNEEWIKQLLILWEEKLKWSDCMLDYIKIIKEFDKKAIENNLTNEKREKDGKWKIIPVTPSNIWEIMKSVLDTEVINTHKELAKSLGVSLNEIVKMNNEQIICKATEKWCSKEEIKDIQNKLNSLDKKNKQINTLNVFTSLDSKQQDFLLNNLDELKKDWKLLETLNNFDKSNQETLKSDLQKNNPNTIISDLSNWWAQIKVWNTEFDLDSKELSIIWNDSEKLSKFVDFKSNLDEIWLWFVWKDRNILFQNIKNKKWENSIDMLDNNVIWEQEFKNLLDYLADEIKLPKKENLEEFKQDFLKIKNDRNFNDKDYSWIDENKIFLEIFRENWLLVEWTNSIKKEF